MKPVPCGVGKGFMLCGNLKCKACLSKQPFKLLALYVLTVLSTPISNAYCEHIFSQLSCVKTKVRNRLELEMLDALIRIRSSVKTEGECCNKFEPTRDMLERFSTETLYGQSCDETDETPLEIISSLCILLK